MLVEIKRLLIENDGYKRNVSLQRMYINTSSVVSISDYYGVKSFLLQEKSSLSDDSFSLIKINEGGHSQDIIAQGTSEQLFTKLNKNLQGKRILND